jgi:UDP-2,4-diacetamido-2,4,6-trideoxy-beta-L-altropyranose hydrolase
MTRCLALADALATLGWTCSFAITQETLEFLYGQPLSRYGRIAISGPLAEAEELRAAVQETCDLLVIDSYQIDVAFERRAKGWASATLVVEDVPTRQHDCDFLLDQTLGRTRPDYGMNLPESCVTFLGPHFALLRRDVVEWRSRSLARNRSRCLRLFVSFGGADSDGWTAKLLGLLDPLPLGLTLDIVLNRSSSTFQKALDSAGRLGERARVWINPRSIAGLMAEADLAIGAGGVTSWERCCLGVPSLVIVIAENQRETAESLEAAHAARQIFSARLNRRTLLKAIGDVNLREMSCAAARICDGKGADRVASELFGIPFSPKGLT